MATQRDGAISPKSTPEGVPPDYNYLPPGEDPPDGHDVVESPAGGTYISPEPTDGEDDEGDGAGLSEDDQEFLETGRGFEQAQDFNDASGFVDPPKTIESVSAGDRLGIMRPDTFQFEAAIVEEVIPDTGEIRVTSSTTTGDGPETVTIGMRDVTRGYNSAGDEFAQQRQADLSSQVEGLSKDELREALPRDTGSRFGEQIMADDFDERFSDVDMSDSGAVVDELRELIQDWEDHYAVDLSPALDEVSNRLSEQGNYPDRDGLTGFEYDLPPEDTDFESGLDEVTETEFDDEHERSIAVQRFLEDRTDFDAPIEVPAVDPESQQSFGSAVKLADETGELDKLAHSVRTAQPGENGMAFGWYDGVKVHIKNDLSNEKVAVNEETGVADTLGEVFLHEIGHASHDSGTEGTISVLQFDDPDIDGLEDKVSKYATSNMSEFIAESYLAQWKGEELPDDVLELYDEYGGPDPPDDPIDFEASFEATREIRDMVRETIPEGLPAMYAEEVFATVETMIEESPDVSPEDFADTIETEATPEGVPDGYNYVPPGEEPPEGAETVESPQGATYVEPNPDADGSESEGNAIDEVEEAVAETVTRDSRDSFIRDDDFRNEVFDELVAAVEAGADPDPVVQTVASRADETESYSSLYDTGEILDKMARDHFASDDPAERAVARRLHDRATFPEEFPDASTDRDENPYANDADDLTESLTDSITPDTTFKASNPRYDEGQAAFNELKEYVESGGDPSQAVLAFASAYDANTLENLSPDEVNGKIAAFGRPDRFDTPLDEVGEDLAAEFRKFNRDPDNYPRELSDGQQRVIDALEETARSEDRASGVQDLSFTRLDLNNVDETVAETIEDTGEVESIVETIEDNISGDSRERFYHGVVENLGSRDTRFGEASLLSTASRGVTSEASNEFESELGDDERSQYFEARSEWQREVYAEETAPLFQLAAEATGNGQVPTDDPDVFNVLEDGAGDTESSLYERIAEHSRDTVRDVYGDSVVAYRGLSPEGKPSATGSSSISDDIANAADAGEDMELEHRTLESWTVDPSHARKFSGVDDEDQRDGVIVKQEIPTDRVMASSMSGVLNAAEDELAVAHDESETIEPEQVLTPDEIRDGKPMVELLTRAADFGESDMETEAGDAAESDTDGETPADDSPEAALTIGVEELPPVGWLRADEDPDADSDAVEREAATPLEDLAVTREDMNAIAAEADEWVFDEGPQGGDRWRNTETGEYVYYQPTGAPDPDDDDRPSEIPPGVGQPPGDDSDEDSDINPEPGEVVDVSDMSAEEIEAVVETGDTATVENDLGFEVEGEVTFVDSDWIEIDVSGEPLERPIEDTQIVEKQEELTGGTPAEELEDMSTTERLEDAFDHAADREGFREAGFRGGNTTGDQMEILRYQDGSRDFAIPTSAYPGSTGVVRTTEEAIHNNTFAPVIIDELGGSAAETAVIESPGGEAYIVKEGLEGGTLSEFTRGEKSFEEFGIDEDEFKESAAETMSAAYFTGNGDLHGGNLYVDTENNELAVIDFDSGGEDRYTGIVNFSSFVGAPGMSLMEQNPREKIYDKALDLRRGEADVGGFGDLPRYANDAADKAARAAYIDDNYELDDNEVPAELQFPPSGVETIDDLEDPNDVPDEFYEVEYVDDDGDVVAGEIEDIVDDPDGGKQVRVTPSEGYASFTMIEDANRFTEIRE